MNSISTLDNQAIALAGIFQSVNLCKSLATTGNCNETELEYTLRSILTLNTDRVIDAYGGSARSIESGLRILKNQFGGNNEARDLDLARYALSLIQLGSNILKDETTIEQLRIGISHAQSQDRAILDEETISSLANLYRSSISHLSPRIMVSGDPNHLNDNQTASKIRAALLGGIRSVVLWRQCGGTRPKLVLNRAAYVRHADGYLI